MHRHVRTADLMGTVVSIHAIGASDRAAVDTAADAAFSELRDLQRVFTPFEETSDIRRIARGDLALDDADPRVAAVWIACIDLLDATGGLFDAWWRGWFDPTGYVKGWSVEGVGWRWLQPLLEKGVARAIGISAGGDMQLFTADDADWVWQVGIADPHHPGDTVAIVPVRNGAVATSGSAERGAHIVDPASGAPATGIASASIVADSLTLADVWATTAVVAGRERMDAVRRAPVASGILIDEAGTPHRFIGGLPVSLASVNPPDHADVEHGRARQGVK